MQLEDATQLLAPRVELLHAGVQNRQCPLNDSSASSVPQAMLTAQTLRLPFARYTQSQRGPTSPGTHHTGATLQAFCISSLELMLIATSTQVLLLCPIMDDACVVA